MVKDAKKLTKVGKAGAVSLAEKRFSFSRISRKIAAGTLAAALLLSPSSAVVIKDEHTAKTEPPKIEAKAPKKSGLIVQNVSNAGKQDEEPQPSPFLIDPLPIDFSNVNTGTLPPVSVKDLETVSAQNDLRLEAYGGIILETNGHDFYYVARTMPMPNFGLVLLASVELGSVELGSFLGKQLTNRLYVGTEDQNGSGESSFYDLTPFIQFYKQVTGRELKYMRIVWDTGYDKKVGDYVFIVFVPITKPNARIEPNTPCLGVEYDIGGMSIPILIITR